jgi:hypothetical protein
MGEQGEHAALVGGQERLAGPRVHPAASLGIDVELVMADDPGGQAPQHHRIHHQRPELLHQVQRPGWDGPNGPDAKNPTGRIQASHPNAAMASLTSNVYPKDSIAFTGSGGGRRSRAVKFQSLPITCLQARKYSRVAVPS